MPECAFIILTLDFTSRLEARSQLEAIAQSKWFPQAGDAGMTLLNLDRGVFKPSQRIVDRVGVRVLRDPYSAKPYVLFYTTKRVGGGVQDFDAIKLVKFAAS